jgi:Polyketide cyclase / dehydrase and lipid transport
VAVRGSREIIIDAPLATIMDTIADVHTVPSWSSIYRCAEVVDTHSDGRPHHVKVTVGPRGLVDTEVLEYHWGSDWVVWDAARTARQWGQHAEFHLTPEGGGTRVRFDITIEPAGLLPGFFAKRVGDTVLQEATDGLSNHVKNSARPTG